jgi:SNF2 family DNA or RNA helicase
MSIEIIQKAIASLANVCDHAIAEDGRGYNGRDAEFGHSLAEQIEAGRNLSPNQLNAAFKMLQTYRKQLQNMGIELPESFSATTAIATEVKAEKPKSNGKISLQGKAIIVTFPYSPETVAKVKSVKGAKWNPDGKFWQFPFSSAADLMTSFSDFEVDPTIADEVKSAQSERLAELAIAQADYQRLVDAANVSAPLANGRNLYQHQKEAVLWSISQIQNTELRGAIMALDMGLGKTLCSLMVAKAYYQVFQIPVFVICPASLKENWFREAEMVGVPIEVFSWAKIPKPLEISQYFLISDEAHYAQNLKSIRGKAFVELSTHENCKGSLALTGTPIKNGRPINLFPLLKATNHELAKNKRDFESYFCAAKVTRFCPWDVSGAAHLDELHARTKNVMFRRTKAQCLDLPEKTRMMRAAEVTGDALKTWKQSFLDAQLEYEQNQGMGKGEALVLLGKLRKAASVAKIETAIEMANDILEEGQQVVIFTEFLDTAKELHKRLGGELLIGETAVSDRQNLVDRFQSGQSKVFISTSRAGGVGITLTASQTVIMVDRPWTSGDAMQCEDRCHRIGQKNSVSVYWLQWHEIDQKIDTILEQKQERIELILEGKRKTLRGIGSPADIAQELCEDILAKGKKK